MEQYPDPGAWRESIGVVRLREAVRDTDSRDDTGLDDRDQSKRESKRVIRCRRCSLPVTTVRERVARNGGHLHTMFNPAGIVYEIGCFRTAPGCLPHGPASLEFTWFAGYAWQVVFCVGCAEHLGWFYTAGDDGFFGLILTKLIES